MPPALDESLDESNNDNDYAEVGHELLDSLNEKALAHRDVPTRQKARRKRVVAKRTGNTTPRRKLVKPTRRRKPGSQFVYFNYIVSYSDCDRLAVALREIRRYQRSQELLLPKKPFARLVREILLEATKKVFKIESTALYALQEAVEAFLSKEFERK